jgi:hypothetical protein
MKKTVKRIVFTLKLTLAAAVIAGLWMAAERAVAWERAAGYPYGKMCNSFWTGHVDTCPSTKLQHRLR